jgi:hypothetical protein
MRSPACAPRSPTERGRLFEREHVRVRGPVAHIVDSATNPVAESTQTRPRPGGCVIFGLTNIS